MNFRMYRMYRGRNIFLLRKGLGVALAATGLTILVNTLPGWIWLAFLGVVMTAVGWYLFVSHNIWR